MLGLIHRTVLQQGPPHFAQWFAIESEQVLRRSVRQSRNTCRPLKAIPPGRSLGMFRRSAFGLVDVYNRLPNTVVAHNSVSSFQGALAKLVEAQAISGNPNWHCLFSPRCLSYQHPLRDIW